MFKKQTMKKLVTFFALMSLSLTAISQVPGGFGGFGAAPKKETVIPGTAQFATASPISVTTSDNAEGPTGSNPVRERLHAHTFFIGIAIA